MKLDYSHSGRQFFFLTLTVAGREKLLSRLVDAQSRPALSEAGEVVKAALLALHRVNAAVTVSDFVIMPDHFHFIISSIPYKSHAETQRAQREQEKN